KEVLIGLEGVYQLARLARLDVDGIAAAVVHLTVVVHVVFVRLLRGLVAEKGVVFEVALVREHEAHGLVRLDVDVLGREGNVHHVDADGARRPARGTGRRVPFVASPAASTDKDGTGSGKDEDQGTSGHAASAS